MGLLNRFVTATERIASALGRIAEKKEDYSEFANIFTKALADKAQADRKFQIEQRYAYLKSKKKLKKRFTEEEKIEFDMYETFEKGND